MVTFDHTATFENILKHIQTYFRSVKQRKGISSCRCCGAHRFRYNSPELLGRSALCAKSSMLICRSRLCLLTCARFLQRFDSQHLTDHFEMSCPPKGLLACTRWPSRNRLLACTRCSFQRVHSTNQVLACTPWSLKSPRATSPAPNDRVF